MKNLIIKLQKDKVLNLIYPTGNYYKKFGNNLNQIKDKIRLPKINIDLLNDKNLNVSYVVSSG